MVKIPETFILGAASSAWQTEGWQARFVSRPLVQRRTLCLA